MTYSTYLLTVDPCISGTASSINRSILTTYGIAIAYLAWSQDAMWHWHFDSPSNSPSSPFFFYPLVVTLRKGVDSIPSFIRSNHHFVPPIMGDGSINASGKNHKKYRKDKPWDTEDIDHWKQEEWDPSCLKAPFLGNWFVLVRPLTKSLIW